MGLNLRCNRLNLHLLQGSSGKDLNGGALRLGRLYLHWLNDGDWLRCWLRRGWLPLLDWSLPDRSELGLDGHGLDLEDWRSDGRCGDRGSRLNLNLDRLSDWIDLTGRLYLLRDGLYLLRDRLYLLRDWL